MTVLEITLLAATGLLALTWLRRVAARARRAHAIRGFERSRGTRVITLMCPTDLRPWRDEGLFDVEESEEILWAIDQTDEKMPIDVILHTPGGVIFAAEQVAAALSAHAGRVTVFVPYYALSGGTLIALAADEIVLSPSAALGPVDPQLDEQSSASILQVTEQKEPRDIDDATLILTHEARKAQQQARAFVESLLHRSVDPGRIPETATVLTDGRWTHDFPISVNLARELGLSVSDDMPPEVPAILRLSRRRRARGQVWYLPGKYRLVSRVPVDRS